MKLDFPSTLRIHIPPIATLDIISDNVEERVGSVSEERVKESTNDRDHSGRENDNRDVVSLRPAIELDEVGVELHLVLQVVDAGVEGGFDAVHHVSEGVAGGRGLAGVLNHLTREERNGHTEK